MNIGAALGGVIGGVLASTSYVELFLGNAAACLLFGVVVAVLLRDAPQPRSDQDDADTQADRAVGYRQALADRTLVRFLHAIGPLALWALVGAAGLLAAQLCLPRRRAASTVDEPDS